MKITASYALLIGTVAALLLMLTPGVAKAQSTLSTPTNLTATPGVGAIYLEWTPPPAAEYHFVAWLPVGANPADAQIRPVGAAGRTVIAGLLPQQTYHFTVIAGRWEWSPANYGPIWSGWTPWVTAPALDRPLEETPTSTPGVADDIATDSTSAGAGIKITLTIGNLPMDMRAGSSVVLYLEDDFYVPDIIARDTVFFRATNQRQEATNYGIPVYATDPIEIEEDDYFYGDDDTSIRVYLPDFNTGDGYDGFQGPVAGQTLTMVIAKEAGIKNPTEAHDNENDYARGAYKASYDVLTVGADVDGTPPGTIFEDLMVKAKISLSDEDNTRGYELTVTGSGFNNGATAAVYVLADDHSNPDLAALMFSDERSLCRLIIRDGHRVGIARVGNDDRVAITFEVTVPIFRPGNDNYLCMIDGEGRMSYDDVEQFQLEPSIRVLPTSASIGDTITVSAQDYPNPGANFTSLEIANQVVFRASNTPSQRVNIVSVNAGAISEDGSATATFAMPSSVGGSPLEGTVRIDSEWGNVSAAAKITLTGSATLGLSIGEARANESVTILGEDFGALSGNYIDPANITIDGVPLLVDDDSLDRNGRVAVSDAGRFTAIVHLWNATSDKNPALTPGTHTILAVDNAGFYGTASIVIKDPSLTVTPSRAGPRDYVTIIGSDWPADNLDSDANVKSVVVQVDDNLGLMAPRAYTVIPDAAGRFTVDHRVSRRVIIPSTNQVEAIYGHGEIVTVSSFDVPPAQVTVTPGEGSPGDEITLSITGMPVYTAVGKITIGGILVNNPLYVDFRTDLNGTVDATVPVPGLDPGTYSVVVRVGAGANKTVAIGSLTVVY